MNQECNTNGSFFSSNWLIIGIIVVILFASFFGNKKDDNCICRKEDIF